MAEKVEQHSFYFGSGFPNNKKVCALLDDLKSKIEGQH